MKLATWSTHPVHVQYRREIHWPSNDEDGTDYVILRLVTDDGLVGVAEGGAKPAWERRHTPSGLGRRRRAIRSRSPRCGSAR